MNVQQLIQRLPRAESASLAVTSVEEAEELVVWTKNPDRFIFRGEVENEPGIFLFHYYEPAAYWYWEVRSDSGAQLVRREPATRPDSSAEISWPENYASEWEPYETSPFA